MIDIEKAKSLLSQTTELLLVLMSTQAKVVHATTIEIIDTILKQIPNIDPNNKDLKIKELHSWYEGEGISERYARTEECISKLSQIKGILNHLILPSSKILNSSVVK